MEWFQGSIMQAIRTSKDRKAYFVVYVEGNDDASKATTEVLNKPTVAGKLNGVSFVSIKLLKDSEQHKQFAEIYKMVPVPSVFFIAQNGRATEVVVGKTEEASLESLLLAAVDRCAAELTVEGVSASASIPDTAINPPAETVSSVQATSSSSSLSTESSATNAEHPKNVDNPQLPAEPSNVEQPSLDEKVEKAKQLISQKNDEKRQEELNKQKEVERERRRVGQEMHKAKLNRQDQEMKEALEERKKNSIEEAAARKKILDQIAQDKADRMERERMRAAPTSQPMQKMTASAALPANGDSARIQFRLPTGETRTHVFPADTTLNQIRQYIDSNIELPFGEYQIATTFPRREFTWRENEQNLRSLLLLPSAVLLILPVSGNIVSRPNGWANAMVSLFWSIFTPLLSLGNYISSFIFGGGRDPGPTAGSSNPAQSGPAAPSPRPSAQPPFNRTTIRKRGNIHTLADESDNKDDNNTWNGNSTQQM